MKDQLLRSPKGIAATICCPRSPANRRARGSRNSASGRSVSCARYTATHRAVSEMLRIGAVFPAMAWPIIAFDEFVKLRRVSPLIYTDDTDRLLFGSVFISV